MLSTILRGLLPLAIIGALGCPGDAVDPPAPAITLNLSSSTAALSQGGTTALTVTIGRTNFSSAVSLAVEGLPNGVTAAFAPSSVPDGASASTLTLSATASAAPGPATLTVRATGAGVSEQSAQIALTVSVTGSYSLSAAPTSVSMVQGSTGSSTIALTRTGGFAGSVALTVSGAPNGLTATLSPASTTGTNATLSMSASTSAPTGTHTLTVTGVTAGLPNQTTTLSVQITAPPSTTSLTFNFCSENPLFVAIQNEGESWNRVVPTSGTTYTFDATAKFGLLTIAPDQSTPDAINAFVIYTTVAEIRPLSGPNCVADAGSRSLNGSVSGLSGTQQAVVSTLFSGRVATATAPSFSFTGLPERALDFVVVRYPSAGAGRSTPDRVIIRRGVNSASGTTLPPFDFAAAEAVPLTAHQATVSGADAGESVLVYLGLETATTQAQLNYTTLTGSGTAPLMSVPASLRVSGDLHGLYVSASRTTGAITAYRGGVSFYTDGADKSVGLKPALATPTTTVAAASPYLRLRTQLPFQSDYDSEAQVFYSQSTAKRDLSVQMTRAYLGTTAPTTWDLVFPDLSTLPGFDANWMLKTGQPTTVDVFASNGPLTAEQLPTAGLTYFYAEHVTTTQTAVVGATMADATSGRRTTRPAPFIKGRIRR